MDAITDIQMRIYDFLKDQGRFGVTPSVREIGSAVGLKSPSSVQANLDALEKAGYIEREPGLKRSIRIMGMCESVNHVPLLGTVAAGVPILAMEDVEEYIPYSGFSSSAGDLFALRVQGDSMVDAAILDGDIVVVEQCSTARNSQIVVALVGEEATVKRFFKENGYYRLQPENDNYEPIIVNEVSILGKVVGLIRNY